MVGSLRLLVWLSATGGPVDLVMDDFRDGLQTETFPVQADTSTVFSFDLGDRRGLSLKGLTSNPATRAVYRIAGLGA